MALDQPQMKAEQGQKDGREHHNVQGKEALHGKFAHIRAAAQHVGHIVFVKKKKKKKNKILKNVK